LICASRALGFIGFWPWASRSMLMAGTIRNFVRGGAGYHLGGCLNEALTERDGELGFSC
jgi:hypothetical protein